LPAPERKEDCYYRQNFPDFHYPSNLPRVRAVIFDLFFAAFSR